MQCVCLYSLWMETALLLQQQNLLLQVGPTTSLFGYSGSLILIVIVLMFDNDSLQKAVPTGRIAK